MSDAYNTKYLPSKHAMEKLEQIYKYGMIGMPAQEINFTVRDKLLAFNYVSMRKAPSHEWYKTHKKGRTVDFLFITRKGKIAIQDNHDKN